MVAGIAIGGLAVERLHAQAKPPVYSVAEITVTDMDAYMKEYVPQTMTYNKTSGAKLLAASAKVTQLSGGAPQRVAINVWPSLEALQAARSSPEFTKLRTIGEKYATFHEFAVEGVAQ